jgi:hypothetical protein
MWILGEATLPNMTEVAPLRWVPVILTLVPPTPGPLVGLIFVMVGATAEVLTVQVKVAVPEAPEPSVALTVTDEVPAVVGVPVMVPLEAPIDSPAGNPVADHVMVGAGELCESVAVAVTGVMATPVLLDWLAMGVTETVLVMVQVKVAVPEAPEPSVALRVTDELPAVVGVPVMVPVEASMDSPAGSPVADQVRVAPDWESVAALSSAAMGEPDTSDWAPGLVTDTVLVMVQVKVAAPVKPALSVTVMVTAELPPVVGVPLMTPVEGSMDRPGGSVPPSL